MNSITEWEKSFVMLEKFLMKNVISLCTVEKFVDNKLAVYPKKTDLLTFRTKCTFDALPDICIHHEKKYIGRYQATQRYF